MVEPLSYSMVLPPGWIRVGVQAVTDADVDTVVADIAAQSDGSPDPGALAAIAARLRAAVAQAKAGGGQDLCFPTKPLGGVHLPMSLVVFVSPPPPAGKSSTDVLMAFAAKNPGSEAIEVAGRLAVRASADVHEVLDDDGELAVPRSRRMSFMIDSPDAAGRFMLVSGTILLLDDQPEVHEAMQFLVDAIVNTIGFESQRVDA